MSRIACQISASVAVGVNCLDRMSAICAGVSGSLRMRKTDQPIVVIERTAPVMNATFEIAGIPLASTASLSMPITTKVAGGRYARVWASPEIIVDRGHIALLQAEVELGSKKSEIHLGQIGNLQYRVLFWADLALRLLHSTFGEHKSTQQTRIIAKCRGHDDRV